MKSSSQDLAESIFKNITGTIKEAAGKAVGNPRLEAGGRADKIEGQVWKMIGEIKLVLGS